MNRSLGRVPLSPLAPTPPSPIPPLPDAFCPYPSFPPPAKVRLVATGEHPCMYLPGRTASNRALWAESMPPELYHAFMGANFRRSGKVLYQPVCRGCRECRQIRVPVAAFHPNKSQRRCWRRNHDLAVTKAKPRLTEEKFELYSRYVTRWHGKSEPETTDGLKQFLYSSPVDTIEYEYRDPAGRLLGVGICDFCSLSLSTVYFYYDPDQAARGIGTFAAMYEIEEARSQEIPYYYLGFWIEGCATMHYKAGFKPSEALHADGVWRPTLTGVL